MVGDLLHGVAVVVAGGKVHRRVHACRVVAQDAVDGTDLFEDGAPVEAREKAEAADGVGHRHLVGRLLAYDALEPSFTEFRTRRDPRCRLCGDAPEIKTVEDLAWSCHFDPAASRERATVGA